MGRPFALPKEQVSTTLVGGGYGTAPLFALAEQLRARGCRVDFVIGAATEAKLFGALEAKRMSQSVAITTEDGSVGERGRISDVLPGLLQRNESDVVYACGPMGMLRVVTDIARAYGAHSQVAVEEAMACGIGVCMTCVLPVIGDDGVTRMARSCVDGPVFNGDSIRWDALGTVPADAIGAPVRQGVTDMTRMRITTAPEPVRTLPEVDMSTQPRLAGPARSRCSRPRAARRPVASSTRSSTSRRSARWSPSRSC